MTGNALYCYGAVWQFWASPAMQSCICSKPWITVSPTLTKWLPMTT
jgi:hypothetical protein